MRLILHLAPCARPPSNLDRRLSNSFPQTLRLIHMLLCVFANTGVRGARLKQGDSESRFNVVAAEMSDWVWFHQEGLQPGQRGMSLVTLVQAPAKR